MFRNRLENMIDMRHELVKLAGLINWQRFDEAFGPLYAEQGQPGLPTRLMAGLHLVRDIERKVAGNPALEAACAEKLSCIKTLLAQKTA
jgi:hypothetical protein